LSEAGYALERGFLAESVTWQKGNATLRKPYGETEEHHIF
jgi:hypothetical protein